MKITYRFLLLGVGHEVFWKQFESAFVPPVGTPVHDPAFEGTKKVTQVVVDIERAGIGSLQSVRVELEDEVIDDEAHFADRSLACRQAGWEAGSKP